MCRGIHRAQGGGFPALQASELPLPPKGTTGLQNSACQLLAPPVCYSMHCRGANPTPKWSPRQLCSQESCSVLPASLSQLLAVPLLCWVLFGYRDTTRSSRAAPTLPNTAARMGAQESCPSAGSQDAQLSLSFWLLHEALWFTAPCK